jgi:hypothetical protein
MPDYPANSKKMSPNGDAVAIRTILPDEAKFANQQWLAAFSGWEGAQFKSYADVALWADVPETIDG